VLTSKKGSSSLAATRSRAALVGMERASPCTHTGTKMRRGKEQAAGSASRRRAHSSRMPWEEEEGHAPSRLPRQSDGGPNKSVGACRYCRRGQGIRWKPVSLPVPTHFMSVSALHCPACGAGHRP
jgi:hypothetical protein